MRYRFNYIAKLVFAAGLVFIPAFTQAACLGAGYTVIFVNGVFDTRDQAEADKIILEHDLGGSFNGQPINYYVGYNQTHLEGLGDLAEVAFPSLDQYDLDTILMQTVPDVATRKILIVGHSQGAQYGNAMYDYLLAHGEPKSAVGIYAVATPASSVAGGGGHRTYSGDLTINSLRGELGFNPLPANLDFADPYPDNISRWPGHSFSNAYLAAAPDTIVGDIKSELAQLQSADADTAQTTCFDPPQPDVAYQTSAALLGAGDTASLALLAAGTASIAAGGIALQTAGAALAAADGALHKVAADIGVTVGGINGLSHANEPQYDDTNFEIISKLYGSSLTKEEYDEYLGSGQTNGGAVALAAKAQAPVAEPSEARSTQRSFTKAPAVPIGPAPGVSSGGSGQVATPVIVAASVDITPATTTEDVATSTDAATTTTLTAAPFGSPVVDNFDSYDDSGWTAFGDRGIDFDAATDTSECRSGGCLKTNEHIDNDFLDEGKRMYQTGAPHDEGSLTIWIRHHLGFEGSGGAVEVCVGPPGLGGACDGLSFQFLSANQDDEWHEYYFAWRDDGNVKDICTMRDDTDSADCSWGVSTSLAAGDTLDTVAISGDGVREDLGDTLWFDDLNN